MSHIPDPRHWSAPPTDDDLQAIEDAENHEALTADDGRDECD